MSLIAKNSGGGDFENVPVGVHVARCYRIVDLGTHEGEWKGKKTVRRQVSIYWELPNALMSDGRPFSIFKTYTLSLAEKAGLRKDLEAWRGRQFSTQELEGFDLTKVLGHPVMLNIVHVEKDGKTFSNISSMMPLVGGMVPPAGVNPTLLFTMDNFDGEVFEGFPDGLKNKIMASKEYKEMAGGGQRSSAPMDDSDIPF